MKISMLLLLSFLLPTQAQARLNVVATIPDLQHIVNEVGGDLVLVDTISKGTQDPHFIEAKPSFMVKASRADLVVAVGLDLEVGWLPSIQRGARNPKIMRGQSGYLEVGPLVSPLEVATGRVTRAEGDVHPFGNPHFWLDPIRAGEAALKIAERLGQLDPTNAAKFASSAKAYAARLAEKTKAWQTRITASGVKKIVTYHKTLTYFLNRFQLENPAILEPKPGIPPTSAHTLEVIRIIRDQKVPLILIENYFDPSIGKRIQEEAPAVRIQLVPVSVGGGPGVNNPEELYETLVKAVEGK